LGLGEGTFTSQFFNPIVSTRILPIELPIPANVFDYLSASSGWLKSEQTSLPKPQELRSPHPVRFEVQLNNDARFVSSFLMRLRCLRLTNAFSKTWENLSSPYCLHFGYYDFCRMHRTVRVTSAMEAGISDHVWELAELLSYARPHSVSADPAV